MVSTMEHAHSPSRETESSPARPLSDTAHAALRAVLGEHVRRSALDQPLSPHRLRRALRLLCDDARRRGVRAEQLVVAIKQAWGSLPESRWRPGDDRGTAFLQRVVTVCIEEYYADENDRGDGDGPGPNARVLLLGEHRD
jgi:hypothetical protein